MQRIWIVAVLLIAGCGSPVDFLTGDRVEGDAKSVSVKADSAAQAAPMALGHCNHYGLGTQFDRELEAGTYRYRCVAAEN